MRFVKSGLQLIGTHAVMSIIQFVLMPSLFSILENNQIYQWFIGLLYIAIFWFIIYVDMSGKGLDDCRRGNYAMYNGFITGLVASVPPVLLYILAMTYSPGPNQVNWFTTALRVWLIPYTKIFVTFDSSSSLRHLMPDIAIIPIVLFVLGAGISYIDGSRKRKKILDIIDKSDALRAEKSKVNPNI
ncbi:MAG: hypothetical protein GX094_01985 [Clostridiales bacterium]|jgi:hypothetical protein|nr:hypothetical protein [Clostridiales bacterium]